MKSLEQSIYYIYYKINSNKDYYVKEIHNKEKLKILTTKVINEFLINDGFTKDDINYIESYEYGLDKKEQIKLKENDEIKLPDFNKLYLHIIINEETETETKGDIDLLDIYQSNITQLKKEINELSKIDFNNINTENNKKNSKSSKSREMLQMSNFPKIYGLNQNINYEISHIKKNNNELRKSIIGSYIDYNIKEEENTLKLYYLYSYPLFDNDNFNKKDNSNNNVIIHEEFKKNKSIFIDNKDIDNEMKTEDYIYYEQIYSIYDNFEKKQIHAKLNFEPININFDYMEVGPDIIHFKINTSKIENENEKDNNDNLNKFFFNLDINGLLDAYSIHNITKSIETESNAEKIKLLILSTQYINEMKKIFETKKIKNIIYIDSTKNEEDENVFIKCLYSNLLDGLSIKKSFEESKKQIKNDKDMVQLISINDEKLNKLNKGKIELNLNCSLNLDYMKYNNHIKVLERNKELFYCCVKFLSSKKLCVYGYEGVGKKAFVQKVGYFSFERQKFNNVYYLELYSLDEISKKILKYKIEEIKNRNINDEQDLDDKKILIIVYFNFVVENKNIEKLEQLINESDKDYYFLYAFTITPQKKEDKKITNFSSIQLKQFKKYQEKKLLKNLIKTDYKKKIQNIEISDNNMCPNDIYLKALYITLYSDEKDKIKIEKKGLIKKILEYDKIYIKKIFCIFCLLKYGISKDFLPFLFSENIYEFIKFIENKLKYIIFVEKNEKETIYKMDSSYINLIREIFIKNDKDIYYENIELIIKMYSLFFRYLVKNSKFPYDISVEFHAGVNNEFWQDNTSFENDDKYFKELNEKNKNKNNEIYFDDVIYTNNVYDLLKNIVLKEDKIKDDNNIKKYISQISICLPTILHFKKSSLYRDFIINSNIFYFLQECKKDKIMLLKYWLTGELNDKRDDNYLSKITEFILLKIYKSIKDNKQSEDIRDKYEKFIKKINDNDKDNVKALNFNLARFYFLFGKITNDKLYYDKAEDYAKEAKNLYLELVSKLMKISIDLINNEFDKFNKNFKEFENEYNLYKHDISLENSDIEIKMKNIKTLKYELFNNYIKNKLFFFISNPFYDENGENLKEKETESNNPFYLKYKLSIALPGLQLEFQNIDYELNNLKKCITYPIRFLYIGSDYFNEKGNLFSEDKNFKSCLIENEKIKKIIDESKFKESCEIVILGIANSGNINDKDNLLNIFKENKFRHIIYVNYQELNNYNLLKIDNVFYCYFQKCFFNFVEDFLFYLSKSGGCLTIKEAFRRANNNFDDNIRFFDNQKILEYIGTSDVKFICMIGDEKNDNDIYDFGYFNEDNFNPFSSNKKSNIIKINRDLYDEDKDDDLKQNNLYFRRNPFMDVSKNEVKIEKKNFMKYYKFPGQDSLRPENFKKLVNKRFYSMKNIIRDLINLIGDKNNKIINIYGNEFKGKTKLSEEICKHFYMRNFFKKGIFIIDFRLNNRIKDIPELKYHDKNEELLLVFEHVDKINNDLFEWLDKLNVQMVIITNEKINENIDLDNNDKNKKIKNAIEVDEIETIEGNENIIIEHNEKKSNKNVNKLILNVSKKKIKFYNIDEKSKEYTNNKAYVTDYERYKRIKYT